MDIDIHTQILWSSYISPVSLRSKAKGMGSGNHMVGSVWDKESLTVS